MNIKNEKRTPIRKLSDEELGLLVRGGKLGDVIQAMLDNKEKGNKGVAAFLQGYLDGVGGGSRGLVD